MKIESPIPWYKSRIIVGALISAIGKVLFVSGIIGEISPEVVSAWTDLAVLLGSLVGDAMVVQARLTQKRAPAIKVKV